MPSRTRACDMGEKPSSVWAWVVLVLAGIGLWTGVHRHVPRWVREGIYPYENAWHWIGGGASAPLRFWHEVREGTARRRALENDLALARVGRIEADSIARENATLRRLLEMREAVPGQFVVCPVLSRGDASGWWNTLRIAGGTRDGIRENQPVLAPEGLVGRVVAVGSRSSDVLLITDPNSRIACTIEPDGAGLRGVVFGGGRGGRERSPRLTLLATLDPLFVRFLDRHAEIPPGARVVTAGDGAVFPAGLPVGVVLSSRLEPNGLYHEAELTPMVDPWNLRQVLVRIPGDARAP